MAFQRQCAGLRGQGAFFEFLELGRDISLGVLQRLAADIFRWNPLRVPPSQLDVVAVDAVVANLEVGNPGAFTLGPLQLHEPFPGVVPQSSKLIEARVVSGGDDAAFANHRWRVRDQSSDEQFHEVGEFRASRREFVEPRTRQLGKLGTQRGELAERGLKAHEVARRCRAQGEPSKDSLEIPDMVNELAQAFEPRAGTQNLHRVETRIELGMISNRAIEPAAQKPGSHGATRGVHDLDQGVLVTASDLSIDLEISPGDHVHADRIVVALHCETTNVRQIRALGLLSVSEGRACGGHREVHVLAAEADQIPRAEVRAQPVVGRRDGKIPIRALTYAGGSLGPGPFELLRHEGLRHVESRNLCGQGIGIGELLHREGAARNVQHRQAIRARATQCDERAFTVGVQQRILAQGTRRDDSHHTPLHRPAAGCGISDLLANGHRDAKLDEASQITVHCVIGNSAHRNGLSRRLSAGGQCDVEKPCRAAGVVVEHLVEVPHSVEQELFGVLRFDA